MKKRIFGKEEVEEIQKYYLETGSLRKVEARFGINRRNIKLFIDVSEDHISKRKRLDKARDKIIALYSDGKSSVEIGDELNCSSTAVIDLLKRNNVIMRNMSEEISLRVLTRKGSARKIFQDQDDIELALSMYYSRASYQETADYFSCKLTVIADLNESYMEKSERQEAFKERQSDIGLKGVAGFKKKMRDDPKFAKRMSDRISGDKNICKIPEVRKKILAEWKRNKDRRVAACLKGSQKKTSFEKRVEDVILKNNLPYLYCGNGSMVIGGKCPDFIHKFKKIVVEVFNDIHHKVAYGSIMAYRQARTFHFKEFGYDVIFIPEQFVFDDAKVLRILEC